MAQSSWFNTSYWPTMVNIYIYICGSDVLAASTYYRKKLHGKLSTTMPPSLKSSTQLASHFATLTQSLTCPRLVVDIVPRSSRPINNGLCMNFEFIKFLLRSDFWYSPPCVVAASRTSTRLLESLSIYDIGPVVAGVD